MNATSRLAIASLLAVIACASDVTLPSIDGAPLAQVLADSGAAAGIVGMQAAVLIPGRSAWIGEWGHNDLSTAMRSDVLLSIGGMSRTFVSALILQLVQEGRLSLGDTLGKWVPSSSTIIGSVTVGQLLWSQSGLYPYNGNPAFVNETQSRNRLRIWAPPDLLGFIGTPVGSPGTWRPSNTNYLLLGIIAQKVTGHRLNEEINARFIGPLGLSATWFPDSLGTGPTRPVGASWNGTPGTNFTANVLGPSVHTSRWAALGVMSTAGDIATWTGELFAGTAISGGARAHLTLTVGDDGSIPGQVAGGPGFAKYNFLGGVQYGAGGSTDNGSGLAVWDAASGIVVVVLINQSQASHGLAQYRIVPGLLQAARQIM